MRKEKPCISSQDWPFNFHKAKSGLQYLEDIDKYVKKNKLDHMLFWLESLGRDLQYLDPRIKR